MISTPTQPSPDTYPHPLIDRNPPEWACEWGEDEHGVFAGFRVGEVEQRMRWIPAGTFQMGSPEGEESRDIDEIRHLVTLTHGFWLADTPCTQELWVEVTGENPSRFVSARRPVEQVSWDDCQGFLEKLRQRLPVLAPRLPTEAEWEHACRAGREAATWIGDLKILGARNAPLLDAIAWYGGNSGVGFDLDDGYDSSAWPERQHLHEKAGTRSVGLKERNPWGLADMLGNVYEWCADWFGTYPSDPVEDPGGSAGGSYRVFRGGSWLSLARFVRAAYRYRFDPRIRFVDLGFRLARGSGRGARDGRIVQRFVPTDQTVGSF